MERKAEKTSSFKFLEPVEGHPGKFTFKEGVLSPSQTTWAQLKAEIQDKQEQEQKATED